MDKQQIKEALLQALNESFNKDDVIWKWKNGHPIPIKIFSNSVVRDKNGKLLEVYHGSTKKFDEFNTQSSYYFTESLYVADTYRKSKKNGAIYKTYLNIQNPYIIDAKEQFYNNINGYTTDQIVKGIKEKYGKEYDGVIFKNIIDVSSINNQNALNPSTEYVVFNKSQIKILERINGQI